MFGYIICNRQGLSEEERFRYEQTYCGLCHALKNEFGLMERFTLNFDMTFLAIFLAALYEPEEQTKEFRCVLHPTKKKCMLQNRFTEYAAAMTVALSYYKCLDDWKDERKYHSRAYAALLKKAIVKQKVFIQDNAGCSRKVFRGLVRWKRSRKLLWMRPCGFPEECFRRCLYTKRISGAAV